MLVYGEGEAVPEVLPSHAEVVAILTRYMNILERKFKKTVNQEGLLSKHFASSRTRQIVRGHLQRQ